MSSPKRSSTKRRWLTAADLGIEQPAAPQHSKDPEGRDQEFGPNWKQEPAKVAQEHYDTSGNQRLRNIEENWRRSFNQMRDERDEALAELERVKQQRDGLLAALKETCDLLDRNEIEIPNTVLRVWSSVDTVPLLDSDENAAAEGRAS